MEGKSIKGKESVVKVAAVQMEPKIGHKKENIQKTLQFINEAADNGAKLVVLPELCNTSYMFNSRKELYEVAELIPEGETSKSWIKLAKERKIYISAGIAELGENKIKCYNSSILIGPDGFIGKYRKQHLWNREKLFFEPGDTGYKVYDTLIGRLSMLICFDMWFPEVFRILAMKGADLICIPTNWVDTPPKELTTIGTHLAIVNANINSLFVIAADRVGVERGCKFPGRSIIVGPSGWPNTPMASDDKEEIIYDKINISDARRLNWNEFNVVLRDRRTDLYDIVLGSGEEIKPR